MRHSAVPTQAQAAGEFHLSESTLPASFLEFHMNAAPAVVFQSLIAYIDERGVESVDKAAIRPLIAQGLRAESNGTVAAAIRLDGRLRGEEALPDLKVFLSKNTSHEVWTAAISTLGEVGGPYALALLTQAMTTELRRREFSTHGSIEWIVFALSGVGEPGAAGVLKTALETVKRRVDSKDAQYHFEVQIRQAMREVPGKTALLELIALTKSAIQLEEKWLTFPGAIFTGEISPVEASRILHRLQLQESEYFILEENQYIQVQSIEARLIKIKGQKGRRSERWSTT